MKRAEPPYPDPTDPLDEWLAGDLEPGSAEERAVLAAGAEGALCDELEAHRQIRAQVRALPGEVEPERDLWPEIAARIGGARDAPPARGRGFWQRPVVLPRWAAIAALLALALGAGALLQRRAVVETAPRTADTTAAQRGPVLAAYAKTDRQLDAVRDELRRAIAGQEQKLPPHTRAVVFANLRTIERAIAEIETALAAAPADEELARTYISYRERQIAVLRQANELAARL